MQSRDDQRDPNRVKYKYSRLVLTYTESLRFITFSASVCNPYQNEEWDRLASSDPQPLNHNTTLGYLRRVEYVNWRDKYGPYINKPFFNWCRDYELCLDGIRLNDSMPPIAFCVSQHVFVTLIRASLSNSNEPPWMYNGRHRLSTGKSRTLFPWIWLDTYLALKAHEPVRTASLSKPSMGVFGSSLDFLEELESDSVGS